MTRFILTDTSQRLRLDRVRSIDPVPDDATDDTHVKITVESWTGAHCKASTHYTTVAELKRLGIIPQPTTEDPYPYRT